jgi:hypothetical protein
MWTSSDSAIKVARIMDRTVILDSRRYKAVVAKAQELGTTPQRFVQSLIDAATLTFDEILAPVRQQVRQRGITPSDLDRAITDPAG